ncbi:MAG: hypothetical protein RIC14_14730 [Filomicrobium sp.]
MSNAMIGALVGAVLGLVAYGAIRSVAAKLDQDGSPEKKRTADLFRMVALADLLAFPIAGYFVGPVVLN